MSRVAHLVITCDANRESSKCAGAISLEVRPDMEDTLTHLGWRRTSTGKDHCGNCEAVRLAKYTQERERTQRRQKH